MHLNIRPSNQNQTGDPSPLMKKTLNIICAGSSITWTGGLLSGFTGGLDYLIRLHSGGHVLPCDLDSCGGSLFRHFKLFGGTGLLLNGIGSYLEFDFTGDTLFLCQLIRCVNGYAEVKITADGRVVDRFNNRNLTMGHASVAFTADGIRKTFPLGRPFTRAHKICINGSQKRGEISRHDYDEMNFGANDYLIIRSLNETGHVEHLLCFAEPPPGNSKVTAEFSYGESIGYTACTVGENEQGEMESVYGFAGPKPNYGLDFRYSNPAAFRRISLPQSGRQRIRLEITGGEDPYFVFNFAADRMIRIMNAGIGGWKLDLFLNDKRGRNIDKALSILEPDVIFLEFSANDDWHYFQRKTRAPWMAAAEREIAAMPLLELYEVKNHGVRSCAAPILALTPNSLRCSAMHGVEAGDIARIGREIREISHVKEDWIYWSKALADPSPREVIIRSLKEYRNRFRILIKRIRCRFPHVIVFLIAPAPANYERRQLWGYDIVLKRLAAEFPECRVIEMEKYMKQFQPKDWIEYDFISDGRREYKLPWTGYSQYFSLTPQYDYSIACTDRFVADGYREFSLDDPAETDPRMRGWKLNEPQPMSLIFKTAPPSGIKFRIRYSPGGWSHDYCHPNQAGCQIYSEAYFQALLSAGRKLII